MKYTRRTLAAILGAGITFLFLDVARIAPRWLHVLADAQFVPLLVKGIAGFLVLWLLLTLLAGRVYCSVICPLGILQDAIGRVKTWWFAARKKRKQLRMKYQRPLNLIRYGILAVVAVPYVFGLTLPLLVTDPYSNFGRIATGLFRPVAVGINNGAAAALNAMDNYSLYVVRTIDMGGMVAIFAAVVLVALIVMVWRSGRLWCNTVCPVGTFLGFFSRFSLFRIRINSEGCNSCGSCAAVCKARCIDPKEKTVDASRCVACYNCLDTCKKSAISYAGGAKPAVHKKVDVRPVAAVNAPNPCERTSSELSIEGLARRRFIKGSALALAALPAAAIAARTGAQKKEGPLTQRTIFPLPPGAHDRKRFVEKCTACQLCVTVCPTQVLQPAFMENGLTGMMQPYMRFKVETFCNFECTECIEVCPTHAIDHLTLEEKKLTRVGTAHFIKRLCIVHSKHQDCGACAEHCPTQAVHMVPFSGSLTIPKVEPEYCIGCGGCESICPVTPLPAIFVQGLDVQEIALPPKEDEVEAGAVDDFGF